MDSSTKQLNQPEPDVEQSALAPSPLSTPQGVETPSKSPQPKTNSFHPTAVTFPDQEFAEAPQVRPGTNIDGYIVLKLIASTKMSVVFQARQPGTGQLVALKLIQQGAFTDRESIDRFQQEIKTLGQMQPHKHIVPIYHVGRNENEPYYVMPFLAGGSLSHQMKSYQADRRKSVALIEKIARAVHQLHTHTPKILHRDIKPGNILLTAEAEPLLADFGLIKLLNTDHGLTRTDRLPGTPSYMAPEQTGLVPTPVNERTDIWALGVVLYELLTGKRPFAIAEGEDASKLFWKVVHEEAARPRSLRPDIDAGLEAVVMKCLEKRPEDRFGCAAELADALQKHLRGESPRVKLPGRMRRTLRKHPIAIALAALIFAGLAITFPAVAFLRNPDPDRPLRNLQKQLEMGQPAMLIGGKGRAEHSRVLLGEEVKTGVGDDGFFFAASKGKGLVELARDLPIDRYTFRGKLRHTHADDMAGFVGVYFGHSRGPTFYGAFDAYYEIAFNDIVRRDLLLKQVPGTTLPPHRNFVQFHPCLRADIGDKEPLHGPFANTGAGFFDAGGVRGGLWREFSIRITPGELELKFENNGVVAIDVAAEIRQFVGDRNRLQIPDPAKLAALRACELSFNPRGSLGIVVHNGTAAFSDFVLEPLP